MAVFHVLKDGTQVSNVDGRVVKYNDSPTVYEILKNIRKEAKA